MASPFRIPVPVKYGDHFLKEAQHFPRIQCFFDGSSRVYRLEERNNNERLFAPYMPGIEHLMGKKKTKPGKAPPLQEARHIAMIRDSQKKVRHSKSTIRKSKRISALSRRAISSSRDITKPLSETNRS
jgi:hypothetical protein